MKVEGLAVPASKGLEVNLEVRTLGRQELQKSTLTNMRMGGVQSHDRKLQFIA